MNTKNGVEAFKKIFNDGNYKEEVEFETQMLALSFLSSIEKEAEKQNVNRKQLAKKVGTSASYITQIMRGNKIPNLKILAALGIALNIKFNIVPVEDIQASRRDFDEYTSGVKFDSSRIKKMSFEHEEKIRRINKFRPLSICKG